MGSIGLIYFMLTKHLESKCIMKFVSGLDQKNQEGEIAFRADDPKLLEFFIDRKFDLIVLGQNTILPNQLLNSLGTNIVNVHPAKLPDYRGYAEPAHALLSSKPCDVGFSIHLVSSQVDRGDLITFVKVQTLPFDSLNMRLTKTRIKGYDYLFRRVAEIGVLEFLRSAVPQSTLNAQMVSIISYKLRLPLDLKIFIFRLKNKASRKSPKTFLAE